MKKVKRRKKKAKNEKRWSKMKVKGKEMTLPSPYEQYTKLKTEFVTANDKRHNNSAQHVTYRNIVLVFTLILFL